MVLTLLSDDPHSELPVTKVTICGLLVVRASSG
jgi:hypothetical protein